MIKKIIKKLIAGVIAWFCITLLMMGDQSVILLASYYICLTGLAFLIYLLLDMLFNIKIKKEGK